VSHTKKPYNSNIGEAYSIYWQIVFLSTPYESDSLAVPSQPIFCILLPV